MGKLASGHEMVTDASASHATAAEASAFWPGITCA
jgi:hypothetical protein